MWNSLLNFFFERGMAPHGYCLLWDPPLITLHVVSDALIAVAYFSIPVALWLFVRRRQDLEFNWMLALFAIFIFACGTTHLLSILVLWVPAYGLEGAVKALTAVASVVTAIALWPLLPKLIALPSPTQLQRALDQLQAEVHERELAEEMLRQSQKLQAIGQLTAGIAHDFNNLLTVIGGNLERVTRLIGEPPIACSVNVARSLDHARQATDRAAVLTSQLLSFARKQPLVLQRENPNAIVVDLAVLLAKSVGDKIAVRTDLAPDIINFTVDRSQLEMAMLNLAFNARDAMPEGGEIVVGTRFDGSGTVEISIEDSGTGMDADIIARATEPFFTTKPVGMGTGLGLSQVYGFLSQMGGNMRIESEPGAGTTVRLVFPGRGD